ncbi:DNA-binding transcriptional ArsR family regulator [Paenibacillus endophyticus]|uniref:DNA-binding transcriptional ArsR family regulator n=1 Tax=Paenibacillus endophyticus TaxID=1294268 RepID=A0A7W5C5P4_9BACL|nr:autorepressor SdpR family transcription factor [Paenibacillus endophyticus]MBB3151651.1 DNA-binding transcriptional ArsR family regulator [Paenibacillus endophyticus]
MSINDSFKALSDPNRRKILELLRERDLTAGGIADHFQMTKPSISHHLNLLKQADLVWDQRHGQHIYYSLNSAVFNELLNWIISFQPTNSEGNEKA